MVRYHAFVAGAPKDQTYALIQWPINSEAPSELIQGLSLADNGLIICAGTVPEQCMGQKKDDPVDLTFFPSKGEIFRLALVSADATTKVFFAVVPDPIVKENKGCTLQVVRLMPDFQVAMISGKGFHPNEHLRLSSKSDHEIQEELVETDSQGEYVLALLPFVKNKQGGKTDLSVASADCSPALSFEWGK